MQQAKRRSIRTAAICSKLGLLEMATQRTLEWSNSQQGVHSIGLIWRAIVHARGCRGDARECKGVKAYMRLE